VEALLTFSTNAQARVGFRLPDIHCSSCIQILEKMHGLHPGIISSRIDFPNKKINILFLPDIIGLREIVELLTYLGYEPEVNLDSLNDRPAIYRDRKLILKLGVAGFIFGNVMLLSFPEYFGLDDPLFERAFGYLSLAFCIPLLTFCASDYLNSAYAAILNKGLNIDVPITIGILALFGRSAYEILTHTGPGYLDSLSGFVFFLLIGRWFQKKTYDRISFDRNYQSYFPLHATRIVDGKCTSLLLKNIRPKDRLLIRSGEIIPCDGVLNSNRARIDYSFVTGEETPVPVSRTNKIYAGGRNAGASIQLEVTEAVDQSYLMKLWEEKAINPNEEERSRITDRIGTYFTVSILMIALATMIYWYLMDA
ncbi:MAG: heavy metal translocating P-type ATPase, partial [Saprospiraceae bacterium]|nr:heavy metal translocating P-type ATPase [Saprospiraceae bacterium]